MLSKIKKLDKILLAILIAGLFARLIGSTHGFPFIFHPDEPALVRAALGIRFEPNPAHFDWPHLHFYINYILYILFIKFRGGLKFLSVATKSYRVFPLLWRDPLVFYFISRVFNAILGAFTAIPIYLTGKKLFNRKAGLLAALAVAFTPYHAYVSHFALIDIPSAFWVAWAFYFCVNIFLSKDLKNYLLAGLFIGFAASTKYNGGLMAVMVPIAHFLRVYKSSEKLISMEGIKALVLSGLFAFLGFAIGTPYSIFDYDTFSRTDGPKGAFWQFSNVGKVPLIEQITTFLRVLSTEFAANFGYIFIGIYTLAFFYNLFIKRDRKLWLVFLPSLFLLFYVSGFSKTRAHYFLSAYPFVALVAGIILSQISSKLRGYKGVVLLLIAFALPIFVTFRDVSVLVKKDTRVLMYDWLLENYVDGQQLYYTSSSMKPVMEKFPDENTKKGVEDITRAGYIIVGLSEEENVKYIAGEHEDSFIKDTYEKVMEFDSGGRKGPVVLIYVNEQTKIN
jgi:predicted membrane-bound dolichyl-phosphate-mannose-protein mannosyltransferase